MNGPSANQAFANAVKRYRALVDEIAALPDLAGRVQKLVDRREGPAYTVRKPVVFNGALDGKLADLRMILVGDNPGRREQEQGRYLVGPSGKIAETFFRNNGELGVDFRTNALILNKTPIHSPRTVELKELRRTGGNRIADAVISSQRVMAELLYEFWNALTGTDKAGPSGKVPVWIIGYSEMKKGGVFEAYTETLKELCAADSLFNDSLLLFRHFSMNQFTIDLRKKALPGETLSQSLERIGAAYRERVLA
jgi:hypothetical protein